MSRWALAPAKVNLFLHVGPPRADGFHPIASLMAFADVGDRLSAAPASGLALEVEGPFAGHAPAGNENLVLKAAAALAGPNASSGVHARARLWRDPGDRLGMRRSTEASEVAATADASPVFTPSLSKGEGASLRLDKRLPSGAGLGGGSADAGATLRLLGVETPCARLLEIAGALGSDVPACLGSKPVLAQGRGEKLSAWPRLSPLPAVLAWPRQKVSTAAVYLARDETGGPGTDEGPSPRPLLSPGEAADFLATCRNDLETAAIRLQPLIGEVLEALRSEPEPLLARMSGSGSACFALCRTVEDARALAERLAGRYPGWWVRACTLGEPPLWGD